MSRRRRLEGLQGRTEQLARTQMNEVESLSTQERDWRESLTRGN